MQSDNFLARCAGHIVFRDTFPSFLAHISSSFLGRCSGYLQFRDTFPPVLAHFVHSVNFLDRCAGHIRLRDVRDKLVRAVLHQLRERETAAAVQLARVQTRTGRVYKGIVESAFQISDTHTHTYACTHARTPARTRTGIHTLMIQTFTLLTFERDSELL